MLSANPCKEPVPDNPSANSTKMRSIVLASIVPNETNRLAEVADFFLVEPLKQRLCAFFAKRQHQDRSFFATIQTSVTVARHLKFS